MTDININALGAFRNVNLGKADAIANLKQGGGVEQKDSLGIFLGRMFRSSTTQTNNNAVRTELLKSLGQALGLAGMSEAGGKMTFSADFMAKLEKIIGRDVLKTADFKLNRDGSVSSGKPLTQRRIKAIIDSAIVHSKTGFSIEVYRQKLEAIKKDFGLVGLSDAKLDALNLNEKTPPAKRLFIHVSKALDFLEGIELGTPEKDEKTGKTHHYTYKKNTDKSFIRLNPLLAFEIEMGRDVTRWKGDRYQYRMPGSGKNDYKPLPMIGENEGNNFANELFNALGGELIHVERANFRRSSNDVEPLKKYIAQTLQLFSQKMVDVYLECKAEGKVADFLDHCKKPGACMEQKGKELAQLQERLFPSPVKAGDEISKAQVAELERIADMAGDDAPPDKAEDLVYGVIDALGKTSKKFADSVNWADFSAPAKEKLVGKRAKIVVPFRRDENSIYEFRPLIENGKEVVRPLTAKDVDTIGKACLYNTVNI